MSRVFITGSADGLGRMAAERLVGDGHEVVLHARNAERGRDAMAAVPGASGVATGDLSSIAAVRDIADQAAATGRFDAVIHNAAVGYQERRSLTEDGVEHVFAINVLAPYLLTALMEMPSRLVYLSSGMHRGGEPDLSDLAWERRRWSGSQAYSDSKLWDAVLAFAVARRRPDVISNAVDPGWVATKMGGAGAPDDLNEGAQTQVWLAVSDDPAARESGRYLYHQEPSRTHPAVSDPEVQEGLLAKCAELTGVALPDTASPA